jgi:glycosidase
LFRNSELVNKESHIWFRDKVVTLFDDHDQVRKGGQKARFCAGSSSVQREQNRELLLNELALNTTTLGIPCIYYGSEQGFDGEGGSDRYLREAMFGGEFGAFRSRGRHFFDENSLIYQELSKILKLRKQKIALRRGRQYLRQISGDGQNFGYPAVMGGRMLSIVAWSRHFDDQHLLVALSTDPDGPREAWVDMDRQVYAPGNRLICLYANDPAQIGGSLEVQTAGERLAVRLSLPGAGFAVYE